MHRAIQKLNGYIVSDVDGLFAAVEAGDRALVVTKRDNLIRLIEKKYQLLQMHEHAPQHAWLPLMQYCNDVKIETMDVVIPFNIFMSDEGTLIVNLQGLRHNSFTSVEWSTEYSWWYIVSE